MSKFLNIPFYRGRLRVALTIDEKTTYGHVDIQNMTERATGTFLRALSPAPDHYQTTVFTWQRFINEIATLPRSPKSIHKTFQGWGSFVEDPWHDNANMNTVISDEIVEPFHFLRLEHKSVRNLAADRGYSCLSYVHISFNSTSKHPA